MADDDASANTVTKTKMDRGLCLWRAKMVAVAVVEVVAAAAAGSIGIGIAVFLLGVVMCKAVVAVENIVSVVPEAAEESCWQL